MDYINEYSSPLGKIILASDGTALTGLWFDDAGRFCMPDVRQENLKPAKNAAAGRRYSVAVPVADKKTDDAGGSGAEYKERQLPVFELAARWLDMYFAGKKPDFTPPLSMRGTRFRRDVWEILLTIPYGKTVTYGEIADRISKRRGGGRVSAQAVGGAVAHNPISLIVPCHRVIGADGSLTGYAGGLERKARLLELEGAGRPEELCYQAWHGQTD